MKFKDDFLRVTLCVLFICVLFENAKAKSVFIITDHNRGGSDNIVQVYETVGDQLEFQYQSDHFPYNGSGAVDLAVTSDSGMLFASYDQTGYYKIELVHAQTMEPYDTESTPKEIAGLVFDNTSQRLLAMQRQGPELHIYKYIHSQKSLTLGEVKILENIDDYPAGAYGICLDENEDRLYVTDNTNVVRYYDIQYYETNDPNFTYAGSIEIEVNGEDKDAIGVAIYNDGDETKYLYTAGYTHPEERHGFLVRTDPNNPNRTGGRVGVNLGIDRSTVGLAVDEDTGLLYVTTYHGTEDDSIQVYDPLNWPTDPCDIAPTQTISDGEKYISGPAGLVVGPQYMPPFEVVKIDDLVGCASPRGQQIEYTINVDYQWDGYEDPNIIDSLEIVDYLSAEVNFVSAQPNTGQYEYDDPNGGWYTWILTDANSFEETQSFKLFVESQNARLTPGGVIENVVEAVASIEQLEHSSGFTLQTHVCDCSGYTEVIYVDKSVSDPCDGSSWDKAFKELKDAIAVALPCDEVWVADGTYEPTTDPCDTDATFSMVNGVGVYGGFEGGEEYRYERDWGDPCKVAVLSGDIGGSGNVDYVVFSDANDVVGALDGFTITGGGEAGIYCEKSSPIIQHNKFTDNSIGIYCNGTKDPTIKNNWIYGNDYGIYFDQATDSAVVRNNTVVYNDEVGIFFESGIKPLLTNCILWGNGDESVETQLNWEYLEGLFVQYSCIQDSNDVTPQAPYYTINTDPCFADAPGNDYHLDGISPCIDKGDPNGSYAGERDIDKHFRVLNGDGENYNKRVDMGADEYCNQGSDNDADFNEDWIVNYIDFAIFGKAWLSYGPYDVNDPNTHNWNPVCNISEAAYKVIDANDLIVFAQEWLWMTCEGMKGIGMMEMMMGMGGGMGRMMGAESMLISETATVKAATQQQISEVQAEPSVEEQIAQAKRSLNFWLREDVREGLKDKDRWLQIVTDLEEWLKELEDRLEGD